MFTSFMILQSNINVNDFSLIKLLEAMCTTTCIYDYVYSTISSIFYFKNVNTELFCVTNSA